MIGIFCIVSEAFRKGGQNRWNVGPIVEKPIKTHLALSRSIRGFLHGLDGI